MIGEREHILISGASCNNFGPDMIKGNRSIMDEAYIPQPFPKHLIDSLEWNHVLATLSIFSLSKQTQFYSPDGYDIIPIRMVQPIRRPNIDKMKLSTKL